MSRPARKDSKSATVTKKGMGGRRVYEALREQILNLELQPGSDLDEAEMVMRFGASRTPVREAFIRLAADQLITLLPNRGARVAELSLNSAREFFEALSLTQRAVNHWAALRGSKLTLEVAWTHLEQFEQFARAKDTQGMAISNREFHLSLAAAAKNTFVQKMYRDLLNEGMRLTRLAVLYEDPAEPQRAKHFDGIMSDHRAMMSAIQAGDSQLAERLAAEHTNRFRNRIMDYLRGAKEIEVSDVAESRDLP